MSKRKNISGSEKIDKRVKKETILKLVALVLTAGGIFAFYRIMMNYRYFEVVFVTYLVAMTALIGAYIIYNRAFARKNMTVDMLPDEWTLEQKQEFIEDGKRRLKRSSWMLMLIIGFVFTFAFDLFELYFIPWLDGILS